MELQAAIKKDPGLKLLSRSKLYATLKDQGVTKKQVDEYLNPRELTQIYAKPQRTADFIITSPPRSFQIDIALMPRHKRANDGIERFFIAIDILSRKAFTYPLQSGSMADVLVVYKEFLKDVGGKVHKVEGDAFFNSKPFLDLNREHDIFVSTHVAKDDHVTPVGNRLGIIDRFTRTIKNWLYKAMLEHNWDRWTDELKPLTRLYNNTPHSGINDSTPNEVFDDEDFSQKLHEGQVKKNQKLDAEVDIPIGETVRLMEGKKQFQKEKAAWTTTLHTVEDKIGYSYKVSGVKRLYRPGELLIVKDGTVTDRISSDRRDTTSHSHALRLARSKLMSRAEAAETVAQPVAAKGKRVVKRPARFTD